MKYLYLLLWSLILSSCMTMYGKRNTYSASAAEINGARVSMLVMPQGTQGGSYSMSAMVVGVAVANLDGPFSWRFEAEGKEGVHQALYVQRVRTVTTLTKRDEWYPQKWINDKVPFKRKKSDPVGVVKAAYDMPGYLAVKPKVDGALDVYADVVIEANGKRDRKTLKFHLDPAEKKDLQNVFIPAEIVSGIGKSSSEWQETGWDR